MSTVSVRLFVSSVFHMRSGANSVYTANKKILASKNLLGYAMLDETAHSFHPKIPEMYKFAGQTSTRKSKKQKQM